MSKVNLKTESLAELVQFIRGEKVLLDFDLATLYGVETRALKQAVRRNRERFPSDFLFELTENEIDAMVSQSVIPSRSKLGGATPYAFTEQGVAMLSSVLRTPRAISVNIAIMRTFVQLRRLMDSNRDLARKIEAMEEKYDKQFTVVFDAIKQLIAENEEERAGSERRIGFPFGYAQGRRSKSHWFITERRTMPETYGRSIRERSRAEPPIGAIINQ